MKKKRLIALLTLPFILAGCNATGDITSPEEQKNIIEHEMNVTKYTIKFASDDGTILKTYRVDKRMMPVYDGETPTKYCEDYLNEYEFAGWDKEIVEATEDTTYTAQFNLKVRPHDYDLSYRYNDVYFEGNVGTSYSGWLLEFLVGRCAAEGDSYNCTTGTSNVGSFKTSNPDVVELVKGNSPNSFTLKAKKAGNSVIKIYNEDGELTYRQLIRVRPKHTPAELLKMMYLADSYRTVAGAAYQTGDWKFVCVEDNQSPRCLFAGADSSESLYAAFNLEYSEYKGGDYDLHCFRCRDLDTNATETSIYEIDITPTGDLMYVYYNSGFELHLLTMLCNSGISYVYND